MLNAIANAQPMQTWIENTLIDDFTRGYRNNLDSWDHAVGEAFLRPFGLFVEGAVMSAPRGTQAYRRAKQSVKGTRARVQAMRKDVPYPVINSSAVISGDIQVPLEFTPLHSGVPMCEKIDGRIIGGAMVESFGFGSFAPESIKTHGIKHGDTVQVTPEHCVSLAFAMGTSSNAVAAVGGSKFGAIGSTVGHALGGASIPIWSRGDVNTTFNEETLVVDGNATDNSGVVALIRRRVPRLLVNLSAGTSILDDGFLENIHWVPDLFKGKQKVFEEGAWDELYSALKSRIGACLPGVYEQTLSVVDNEHFGVKGGWTVRILWISPNRSKAFEEALPAETRKWFDTPPTSNPLDPEGVSSNFPFVETGMGNFSPELVHLLAESAAYHLLHGAGGEKKLRAFFEG